MIVTNFNSFDQYKYYISNTFSDNGIELSFLASRSVQFGNYQSVVDYINSGGLFQEDNPFTSSYSFPNTNDLVIYYFPHPKSSLRKILFSDLSDVLFIHFSPFFEKSIIKSSTSYCLVNYSLLISLYQDIVNVSSNNFFDSFKDISSMMKAIESDNKKLTSYVEILVQENLQLRKELEDLTYQNNIKSHSSWA